MPWVEIGRFLFDLAEVVLLAKGISPSEGGPSVTISLASGKDVELAGEEARRFLELFSEFTNSRSFGVPPPVEAVRSKIRSTPSQSGSIIESGILRAHHAPDHNEA